jgi:hypothetical protein
VPTGPISSSEIPEPIHLFADKSKNSNSLIRDLRKLRQKRDRMIPPDGTPIAEAVFELQF